jgi:hypothetical protein
LIRLLLVLAALALVISPAGRAKVAPYTHWLLDPVYEWSVESRLGQISHAIDGEAAAGRAFPTTTRALGIFLESFYGKGKTLDSWGNELFMKRDEGGLRVMSAGRDGRPGTADDLRSQPLLLP